MKVSQESADRLDDLRLGAAAHGAGQGQHEVVDGRDREPREVVIRKMCGEMVKKRIAPSSVKIQRGFPQAAMMLKERKVFLEQGRDAFLADDCLRRRNDRCALRRDRRFGHRTLKHGSLLPARLGRDRTLRDAALCGEERLERSVECARPESAQHSGGLTIGQVPCLAACFGGTRRSPPTGVLPVCRAMRAYRRGKRWLLLPRWRSVRRSKRQGLRSLLAAN